MKRWDPSIYESNNPTQQIDSKYFLEKYSSLLYENVAQGSESTQGNENKRENKHGNKNTQGSILDVGCGGGYVTSHILEDFLGNNFGELIGVDANKQMIEYAQETYGNEKIKFDVLDILTNELPEEFLGRFDRVFSFYCLHWVEGNQQNLALSNVHRMMKKGGTSMLLFLSGTHFQKLYKNLGNYSKYNTFIQNFEKSIPDYFNIANKKAWYSNLLKENGFAIKICDVVDRSYKYSSITRYIESYKAVEPETVPEELQEDYYNDQVNECRRLGMAFFENDVEVVEVPYQLIVVVAEKI